MAYSEEALAFSTIPVNHQIRLEDRISYLYLEYTTIRQDKTGVVAYSREDDEDIRQTIQIPAAEIAVIVLGPGTSISHAAMVSCARAGATVVFGGGGGMSAYTVATPLTTSSKWAIAQARLVSNEARQRDAAKLLYQKQFGLDEVDGMSIAVMRGIEGRTMRNLYRDLAKRYKVANFHRDTTSDDNVNAGLNLANSLLYGCAAAACAAIGVSPALGVIHRGNQRSLLFDLADTYKPSLSIPIVFKHAHDPEAMASIRREIRAAFVSQGVLEGMLSTLMEILSPHLPDRDDDRLIGGRNHEVAGHTQYGVK
ncbi:type I-E CRISPR-associated endonuclease Cas1 [Trueperella pecoris]|uniref:CRISPR-associated endonuclease Cas1 n=1 Tax=Trueperella pecoris TaxID=2733571 RepID=A0A7M1R017_9ACTO|nr:type I-E CRISPR-associated endonuclease Cas1e [Trueperella pecoris]QOR47682.1 type I-E CRISPR-associated endonuclease Cas1 [Trueperella pecoris]